MFRDCPDAPPDSILLDSILRSHGENLASPDIRDTVLAMSISTILALLALIVALINAANGRAPLWVAFALPALAMIIPGIGVIR